jgi:hypothetical protein
MFHSIRALNSNDVCLNNEAVSLRHTDTYSPSAARSIPAMGMPSNAVTALSRRLPSQGDTVLSPEMLAGKNQKNDVLMPIPIGLATAYFQSRMIFAGFGFSTIFPMNRIQSLCTCL